MRRIDFVFPVQCSHCTPGPDGLPIYPAQQCKETATHWLVDPDGFDNPNGWFCQEHGQKIVAEYREKLGQNWSLRPLISASEGE